jgi:hypothetical protein
VRLRVEVRVCSSVVVTDSLRVRLCVTVTVEDAETSFVRDRVTVGLNDLSSVGDCVRDNDAECPVREAEIVSVKVSVLCLE